MSKVFGHFDQLYVINVDEDIERLQLMQTRLDRLGVSFTRIAAVSKATVVNPHATKVHPGHLACAQSHALAYKDAMDNHYEAIIILEDDALLRDDANEIVTKLVVPQLAAIEWGICYLGCKLGKGGITISPNLLEVLDGSHTHAYCVNQGALPLLHKWAMGCEWHKYGYFDRFKMPVLKKCCVLPMLAVQSPGISSIGGDEINRMWEYFRDFSREDFLEHSEEGRLLDDAWHKAWG